MILIFQNVNNTKNNKCYTNSKFKLLILNDNNEDINDLYNTKNLNVNPKECTQLRRYLYNNGYNNSQINDNCEFSEFGRLTLDENNNIKSLELGNIVLNKVEDFNTFPMFTKMDTFSLFNWCQNAYPILINHFLEFPNLKELSFHNFNIQEIPNVCNSQLKIIGFFNISTTEFPSHLFYCRNLEQIYIENSNFLTSAPVFLNNVTYHKEIYLKNNKIVGNFVLPDNVEHLDMSDNNINSIISSSNNDNTVLELLNLDNNNLDENVFESLTKYKNLHQLSLENNKRITKITPAIKFINNLTSLNLLNCSISEISEELYSLSKLEWLSLGTQNIKELPEEIKKLNSLEYLDVENCNFSGNVVIPNGLYDFNGNNNKFSSFSKSENIALHSLELGNNLFNNDFFDMTKQFINLDSIYLSQNKNITKITPSIKYFQNLEYLDLSLTGLEGVSSYLFELENLNSLNISHNPQLNIKIIKFPNQLSECDFTNTNILCYEPGTCENINSTDYKPCTPEEINEIKSSNGKVLVYQIDKNVTESNNTINTKNNNFILILTTGSGVALTLTICFIIFYKITHDNKDYKDDNEIVITKMATPESFFNNQHYTNEYYNYNYNLNEKNTNNFHGNGYVSLTGVNEPLPSYSQIVDDDSDTEPLRNINIKSRDKLLDDYN
ncbi:RNI-like protein [Anaeromyces robustus]|uniref:RNI-like protein n=1 Tax=Anaeromyces robustus TaxID=1754192 RepID=A0A1Y1WBY5_9FUNG|nr:RNI-like protein [Anaeromyces robustus]|eukprot:ORX71043.1 RNI-like protein [Anaeromyces robustus]